MGIFAKLGSTLRAGMSRVGEWARQAPKPTQRQGVGGTNAVGGFLVSYETSPDLSFGPQRFKTLNQMMLNTAVVGACSRYYLAMASGTGWTMEPADDSPEAEEKADICEDIIHDMRIPWSRVVRGAALYKLHGFGVQELIAKRRADDVIGIDSIERRPQWTIEQWDIDDDGQVAGFVQRVPYSGQLVYLPRSKCVYIVDDSITDQPDGVGLLRHAVETDRTLKRLVQLEGWGFECDARGIPVGKAPIGYLETLVQNGQMSEGEKEKRLRGLKDLVKNHIKNPGLGLVRDSAVYTDQGPNLTPSGTEMYGLELLRGDGAGLSEINEAIKRKNLEIARCFGLEHLLLGGDGKGSLALSQTKTDSFAQLITGTLNELAWSFKKDVLEPLFDLNGWDHDLIPDLVPDKVQLSSITEICTNIMNLSTAGMPLPPDDDLWNQLRSMMGIVEGREIDPAIMAALLAQPPPSIPPPGSTPVDPNAPTPPPGSAPPAGSTTPPATPSATAGTSAPKSPAIAAAAATVSPTPTPGQKAPLAAAMPAKPAAKPTKKPRRPTR